MKQPDPHFLAVGSTGLLYADDLILSEISLAGKKYAKVSQSLHTILASGPSATRRNLTELHIMHFISKDPKHITSGITRRAKF